MDTSAILSWRVGVPGPSGHTVTASDWTDVLARLNELEEPAAYQDFRAMPNGAITTLDSGQDWHLVHASDPVRLRVLDGALTNVATSGLAAGYAEVDLEAPVTRIGAVVRFSPGVSGDGTAALVVWRTQHFEGADIPDSPMHLTLTPERLSVDVWVEGTGAVNLGVVPFTTRLPTDETPVTVEATIAGDTVHAYVSTNGATLTARDSRIAAFAGPWAVWESYQADAATDGRASFEEVWADTRDTSARAGTVSLASVAKVARDVAPLPAVARDYQQAFATTVTITGTPQEIHEDLRLPVTTPPSRQLMVSWSFAVTASTSQVIVQAYWNEALTQEVFSQTVLNGTYTGDVCGSRIITMPEGALAGILHFAVFLVGGTAGILMDRANGYLATVAAVPLK